MRRSLRVLVGTLLASVAFTTRATAHVEYVVDGESGPVDPIEFLAAVVSDPANAAILGAGSVAAVVAVAGYLRYRPFPRDRRTLVSAIEEYDAYLPWMLRLAVGLPLVGAGFAGYYFSPAVPVQARVLQVGTGFLLLFGLATRAVAFVGLLAYGVGLASYPELVFAFEFVGGFAGIALLGIGRPSADHLLKRVAEAPDTVYGRVDPVHRLANRLGRLLDPHGDALPLVVRVPLGLNFAFLGVWEKLAQPGPALDVVAKYGLVDVVPVAPGVWVVGAGLVELGVGIALLFGFFTRATASVAFLTLTLTLFGLPDDPVLAHVTLFGLTSALFVTGGGPLSFDRWLADRRA